ncbi:MAG: O-antigen ligase family protein [Anaerolineae bacterium]|nr:O-antigen ligase family protein [Anaerolineae bacterium]
MGALRTSLKSMSNFGFDRLVKMRGPLIGLLVVALGILIGVSINSQEAAELVVSITIVVAIMALMIVNPLNGILLWLFFMAFIDTWVEIPMGAGVPDLSFSRFIAAFLAVFTLAKAAIGKFRFVPLSLTDILIFVVPLGLIISAPLAVEPMLFIQSTVFEIFLMTGLIYFFAKNLVQSKEDLHLMFMVIALFGFVAALYAAFEHATGQIWFLPKDGIAGKTVAQLTAFRGETNIRLIWGIMGGTGEMGRVLALTIPVTFYLFFEQARSLRAKLVVSVMLVAQFYGIIIAMSRTPWIALLLALFVMQFFYPQFRKLFFTIVFIAVIGIGFTWDLVSDSQVANRVNDNVSTLEGRQARWDAGFNMWQQQPIRGWGYGQFARNSGKFRTDGEKGNFGNGAIENDFLSILVASGLIGFGPYALFLLVPLINSFRLFFRARAPDWPGFIKPETIAVYWAVIICLALTSYTAIIVHPLLKLIPFAIAGAVVGSHEHLLRRSRRQTAGSLVRPNSVTSAPLSSRQV